MSSHRNPPPLYSEQMSRLLSAAHSILEQPPPPSLREILTAYRTKGDGDRDMLLAMLAAKTAEDQRLSSVTSLHRSMLEIYQQEQSSLSANGAYHYPTPSFSQSPPFCDQPSCHRPRSPTNSHSHLPPLRDLAMTHDAEHPRKRQRSSRSPHQLETSPSEHLPPSPYSCSGSVEYSPRSRASMAIGSLLSSRPGREANGDIPPQEHGMIAT